MKRVAMLMGLGLLTACPGEADLAAAGLQVGDGGILVPTDNDGGTWLLPTNTGNPIRPLRSVPPRKTLCMLVIGDYYNHSDFPRWIGSYIGDVRSMWFLGEPANDGIYLGPADASLRYTYQKPNSALPSGAETVSLQLRFEKIPSFDVHSGIRASNGEQHGQPLEDPYFLNDIQVQGDIDGAGKNFLDCWDWQMRESTAAPLTPCDNCIRSGRDYQPCDQGQPEGFKLENCFK